MSPHTLQVKLFSSSTKYTYAQAGWIALAVGRSKLVSELKLTPYSSRQLISTRLEIDARSSCNHKDEDDRVCQQPPQSDHARGALAGVSLKREALVGTVGKGIPPRSGANQGCSGA